MTNELKVEVSLKDNEYFASVLAAMQTMIMTLERIQRWNELDASYRVDYGSNGERDYYRSLANECLNEVEELFKNEPN